MKGFGCYTLCTSPEQFLKAFSPMVSIDSGKVIDVSPEQPLKAFSSTVSIDCGKVIDVSPEQLMKASSSMVDNDGSFLRSSWISIGTSPENS